MTTAAAETQAPKPNRMERRRLETREKLLAATAKLVIKKGIEKTTLDDITEAADLGRRTFYYHFSSKDECVQAATAAIYKRHAERIDLAEKSEDPAFIVAISLQVVLNALLNEPITQSMMERPRLLGHAVVEALGEFARRDIQRGMASGDFAPPSSVEKLDPIIMWTIVGILIETAGEAEGRADTLQDYAQTYLMMLGVPGEQARAAADRARNALEQ